MNTKANDKKLVLAISLTLMVVVFFPLVNSQTDTSTHPLPLENANWWNTNWPYRKLITIDHTKVGSPLINFPVLIYRSADSDLANKAQTDGHDIAFVLYSDNTTKLNHEIEFYNNMNGNLVAWVNVTSLSPTVNTKIWMYYGNNACSNQQNVVGTWNSQYVMVQHLNETSGTVYDSTQYGNDGTPHGSMNQNAAGKIDGADQFDGTDDYIDVPNSASLQLSSKISFEVWAKADTFNAWRTIAAKDRTGANEWWFGYNTLNKVDFKFNGQSGININANTIITDTNWHYLVGVFNGTHIYVFVDGVLDCTPKSYASIIPGTGTVNLGLTKYWGDNQFKGTSDEVRLSNVARNSSWLSTSYKNQNNPESFYSIGMEEQYEYTLTITVDPVGAGTVTAVPSLPYHYNDIVQLTANANPGCTFDHWTGDATGNSNPTSITMNGNKAVTAHFTTWSVILNFKNQGSTYPWDTAIFGEKPDASDGQDIYDIPKPGIPPHPYIYAYFDAGLPEPYNRLWEDYRHLPHEEMTWDLYVRSNTGLPSFGTTNVEISWDTTMVSASEYDHVELYDASGTVLLADMKSQNSYTIPNLPDDTPILLKIRCWNEYTLTTTIDPVGAGTVDAVPSPPYHYNDVVQLTANANPGWTFDHWSGAASGNTNPVFITMDNNKDITATFTQNEYTLTITKEGNGNVAKDPDQATYHYGDTVQLTATPDTGWTFSHWTGDATGNSNPTSITMNGNKAVTAHFTTWSVLLNFKNQGSTYPWDTAIFGEKPDASDGQDIYDIPKPGIPPHPYIYAYFDAGLPEPYNRLWEDYRHLPHEEMTWDLYVRSNTGLPSFGTTNVEISWDTTMVSASEYDHVELYDASGTVLLADMKSQNSYTIPNLPDDTPILLKIRCWNEYTLTTTIDPVGAGTIDAVPSPPYHYNDVVQLTANANPTWTFDHWSGAASGNTNPVFITMDDNKAITAHFIPANIPPEANDDATTVNQNSIDNHIDVLLNDHDDDNDPLTIISVTQPSHGTSNIGGGGTYCLYTPTSSYFGPDSFTYTISDGHGGTDTATVFITVLNLHHLSVKAVWNMISIPCAEPILKTNIIVRYNSQDYSWADAVANHIILDYLYEWDRTAQQYSPSNPTSLEPGKGYWMWAYYDCELLIPSNAVGTGQITDLKSQWNMMGLPYEDPLDQTELEIQVGGTTYTWQQAIENHIILGSIYGWDRTTQMYTLETVFNPDYGYWMYAYYECTLYRGD